MQVSSKPNPWAQSNILYEETLLPRGLLRILKVCTQTTIVCTDIAVSSYLEFWFFSLWFCCWCVVFFLIFFTVSLLLQLRASLLSTELPIPDQIPMLIVQVPHLTPKPHAWVTSWGYMLDPLQTRGHGRWRAFNIRSGGTHCGCIL